MFQRAFTDLDPKKWFDRMHPQTLAIATWLLYIDGVFTLLSYFDGTGFNFFFSRFSLGGLLSLTACVAFGLGGFLMANGKRLGWYVALGAAVSPFLLRFYLSLSQPDLNISISWILDGGSLVNFVFEAALVALLVHNMTRSYVHRWLH